MNEAFPDGKANGAIRFSRGVFLAKIEYIKIAEASGFGFLHSPFTIFHSPFGLSSVTKGIYVVQSK